MIFISANFTKTINTISKIIKNKTFSKEFLGGVRTLRTPLNFCEISAYKNHC